MSYRLLIVLAAILALGSLGKVQQTAGKIGVVNVQQVPLGTKSATKDSQELTAKFESKQKDFQGRQNEIFKLEDHERRKEVQLAREIDDKKGNCRGTLRMPKKNCRTSSRGS